MTKILIATGLLVASTMTASAQTCIQTAIGGGIVITTCGGGVPTAPTNCITTYTGSGTAITTCS